MKAYSKSELALGISGIVLGGFYFLWGNAVDLLFGVGWVVIGGIHLYLAFSRKWAEKAKTAETATKDADRKRFGKWAPPVRYFGLGLVLIGLGLLLFDHTVSGRILLLAGVGYTLIIELWLRDTAGL